MDQALAESKQAADEAGQDSAEFVLDSASVETQAGAEQSVAAPEREAVAVEQVAVEPEEPPAKAEEPAAQAEELAGQAEESAAQADEPVFQGEESAAQDELDGGEIAAPDEDAVSGEVAADAQGADALAEVASEEVEADSLAGVAAAGDVEPSTPSLGDEQSAVVVEEPDEAADLEQASLVAEEPAVLAEAEQSAAEQLDDGGEQVPADAALAAETTAEPAETDADESPESASAAADGEGEGAGGAEVDGAGETSDATAELAAVAGDSSTESGAVPAHESAADEPLADGAVPASVSVAAPQGGGVRLAEVEPAVAARAGLELAGEVVGERGRKKGRPAKGDVVEPVAVVGVAGRFPGAGSVEQFWENLVGGVESVRRFSEEELREAGGGEAFGDEELVAVSGALDDVELFDAAFFGLSDREAELTDPAQRLFLEVCQQALEHGGYAGASGRIGIFAGSGMNLYTQQNQPPDYLATRVAYRLGLTGPAIGVQAAWSSSLVAVHLACQALRSGDADLALAGAAAVHVPQATGYHASARSILSPTGHVRAFDADADGTVGGNGVAAVLLKRLDQAIADGDTVYAVIKGSAVTNDGSANGQVELVERALEKSGVPAASISYVEANATGTAAEDTVEFRALTTALRKHTDEVGFCTIGSVKPNIGHLDSAAGMAGLIKTVLMLRHRTLVPTINYSKPNPDLAVAGSPFVVGTEVADWEAGTPLRAGVSALDAKGTSAHVILEEAPRQIRRGEDGPVVLPISAPDPDALADLAELFRTDLEDGTGQRLIDLAGTAAIGRPAHRHRIAVAGSSETELAEALVGRGRFRSTAWWAWPARVRVHRSRCCATRDGCRSGGSLPGFPGRARRVRQGL